MSDAGTLQALALSPLDGRYHSKTSGLAEFGSEAGLILFRILTETRWLKHLSAAGDLAFALSQEAEAALGELSAKLQPLDWNSHRSSYLAWVAAVKHTEKTTNHDVKAVEYFLRDYLLKAGATEQDVAMIHFGCTSADINSTSYAMMLQSMHKVMRAELGGVTSRLAELAENWAAEPLLAWTHGQPASPTTLGKELAVFLARIDQLCFDADVKVRSKMSGAVGGFHAHLAGFPQADWSKIQASFLQQLGIEPSGLSTQIDAHDCVAEYLYKLAMLNQILLGFSQDIWLYISRGIFKLKKIDNEVGSSTMPHKVNPIDFENAEGNLQIGTDMCQVLARKLTVSRLQRDLSDSTALRSLGSVVGYTMLALTSIAKGVSKLDFDPQAAALELDRVPEVLTEGVQSTLRANGVSNAYEQLKEISRGSPLSLEQLREFVTSHKDLTGEQKEVWNKMTARDYVGGCEQITRSYLKNRNTRTKH